MEKEDEVQCITQSGTRIPAHKTRPTEPSAHSLVAAHSVVSEIIKATNALVIVAQYSQLSPAKLRGMKKTLLGLVLLFCFAVPYAAQAQVVIVVHHRHHHRRHHHPYNQMNLNQ